MKLHNEKVELTEKKHGKCHQRVFFSHMNFLFGEKFEDEAKHPFEKEDMKPLKEHFEVTHLWKKAEEIIKESEKEAEKNRGEKNEPIRDVSVVIFKMARPYLRKAIILKGLESICYILLTLVIKIFLPEVEHPNHDKARHRTILFSSIGIATLLAFLTHIFGEHSKAQIFKAKSIAS